MIGPPDTPMVAAQHEGALVQAVVAPTSGPIPVSSGDAVVVRVKNWWESSSIRTVLGVLALDALDAAAEYVMHSMANTGVPFDWSSLWKNVLGVVVLAYLGIRRGTDNSVIRKLPLVAPAK